MVSVTVSVGENDQVLRIGNAVAADTINVLKASSKGMGGAKPQVKQLLQLYGRGRVQVLVPSPNAAPDVRLPTGLPYVRLPAWQLGDHWSVLPLPWQHCWAWKPLAWAEEEVGDPTQANYLCTIHCSRARCPCSSSGGHRWIGSAEGSKATRGPQQLIFPCRTLHNRLVIGAMPNQSGDQCGPSTTCSSSSHL